MERIKIIVTPFLLTFFIADMVLLAIGDSTAIMATAAAGALLNTLALAMWWRR